MIKTGDNGTEMFSQNDILSMGWTQKLVQTFLPDPILKPNPKYKNAAPMKLWKKDDVLKIMENDDFKEALSKAQTRKASAKKAAMTKNQKTQAAAEEIAKHIQIKHINDEALVHRAKYNAYENKRDFLERRYGIATIYFKDFKDPDEQTLNRWIVNYIRHCLTQYDNEIPLMKWKLRGKTGIDDTYTTFRNTILSKIAEEYPKYKDECFRQMQSVDTTA